MLLVDTVVDVQLSKIQTAKRLGLYLSFNHKKKKNSSKFMLLVDTVVDVQLSKIQTAQRLDLYLSFNHTKKNIPQSSCF